MTTRPVTLTLAAWIFVLTGVAGIAVAAWKLLDPAVRAAAPHSPHAMDFAVRAASGALAALGGWLVLRGRRHGRWLLAVWMGGHLVVSALHSIEMLLLHAGIVAVLGLALFRPAATAYLRGQSADAAPGG